MITASLTEIKKSASKKRFAEQEAKANKVTRYSYRLRDENEDGSVESLNAFYMNDDGQLQMSVYFDDVADEAKAHQLVNSVTQRERA